MAKRRIISDSITFDSEFNQMSVEAEHLYLRMLAKSDDFGVIPFEIDALVSLTNPKKRVAKNIDKYLAEITDPAKGFGRIVEYEEKLYFVFEPKNFWQHQGYVVAKRIKSEYLKLRFDTPELFQNFLEISREVSETSLSDSRELNIEQLEVESKNGKIPEKLLAFPGFEKAWQEWEVYRKDIKKPETGITRTRQWAFLEKQSDPVACIEISIRNRWQGLFQVNGNGKQQTSNEPRADRMQRRRENFAAIKTKLRGGGS